MSQEIRNLEPKALWNKFADLNAVPRPSKKEDRVIEFMKSFGNNLGLETIKLDEFVLYPNPASDIVFLQIGTNTQIAGMKVKVVNLLGQVVEELRIQNPTTELSTKNWGASGVYFVQITNQNNTMSITKKVIVNRK